METHSFSSEGWVITIDRRGLVSATGAAERLNVEAAFCAEIMRLAEELKAEKIAREAITRHRDESNEERDALKLSSEEGQEIIAELRMALAVLAGESLERCGPWVANGVDPVHLKGRCPGHLGPKAAAAVDHSLAAWRAIQEGNRAAVEQLAVLERQVRGLEAALAIARSRVEQAGRRAEEAEEEAKALLESDTAIIEEAQEDARLGRELRAILQEHIPTSEGAGDALRRIIRERGSALRDRHNTEDARLDGLREIRTLKREKEAVESANRQYCLELAEKAGEIRELRHRLEAQPRHNAGHALPPETVFEFQERGGHTYAYVNGVYVFRVTCGEDETITDLLRMAFNSGATSGTAGKLLALLDSEEPPREIMLETEPGSAFKSVRNAWRWLREQVRGEDHQPPVAPEG